MRYSRFVVLAAALLFLGGAAFADGVDPAIGVKGGTGSTPWNGSTTQFCATACNLTLPNVEIPYFNNTGDIIASFDFKWDRPQGAFTLLNDPSFGFLNAQFVFPSNFDPNAPEVFLNLIGVNITSSPACEGSCFHPASSEFNLVINGGVGRLDVASSNTLAVPEPGTILLLGPGLGAIALIRLRRKRAANSAL
jgi:hypothetical protein